MVIEKGQLQLEKRAHDDFKAMWGKGNFQGQRYGQAFYDHFKLGRLQNQAQLCGLYEADGEAAQQIINQVFCLN